MTVETVENGIVALLIIGSRVISHLEHRRTEKKVNKNDDKLNDIYIMVNSRMDKMLKDAEEKGRREALNKNKK